MPESIATTPQTPIAYYCAEYGFDANLPIYAGGLGILAGDTVKAAADTDLDFVAIGMLYRGQGMRQRIDETGMQRDEDWPVVPLALGLQHVLLDDMPLFVRVHLTEVDVWLQCWKKEFSNRVTLYLLDADTEQNQLPERDITKILYSGTPDLQVKQQMLLGIGGVKLLTALGIHPIAHHFNEGRPAFAHWQLIRELMDTHGIGYESARKLARQKTVYTNHTLVAAGNQGYSMDLVKTYARYYAEKMHVPVERLLAPGVEDSDQVFSMTRFALNTARKASGVSRMHTDLSRSHWPEYHWEATTNGVHVPTWQHPGIAAAGDNLEEIWRAHTTAKSELADFVRAHTGFGYDANRLTLVWARRLAGYKQLPSLFADLERLRSILKNSNRPVQILVAGKAHQGDTLGKEMLRTIIGHFSKELTGNALFVPNYNLTVAQYLTRGADVWLNTPIKGQEASGTSGMKAVVNGVLQCSVSDGWVPEIDWTNTGWILDDARLSDHFYELLETEIVPLYYQRDNGTPIGWVERMRRTIALTYQVSATRMFDEYSNLLYKSDSEVIFPGRE
jgi:glucan phosphorylase